MNDLHISQNKSYAPIDLLFLRLGSIKKNFAENAFNMLF